ncbi:MAG: hypothetical protein IKU53_01950 [Firmicutes bacterium]|nr:hypothetical protein [Bacillota bacterium]
MNDANKLLLNIIEDRFRRFQKSYSIVTTDFLDMTQGSLAEPFVRSHQAEGAFMFGGYEDAERRMVVFAPDYLSLSTGQAVTNLTELCQYFDENPEDSPIAILDVTIKQKGVTLKHSDYLGSLLSLGIKREKTGDIMVHEGGAQIFVASEIAEYLANNYFKAGRVPLEAKVKPLSGLVRAEANIQEVRISIPSPRLDNAISAVFDVSRKAAVEAINRGIVFVDNVENKKPDYTLKGGEKLVLRGKGKAIYKGINGTSKKGKLYAEFDRYI